jgi:hypothetical protein
MDREETWGISQPSPQGSQLPKPRSLLSCQGAARARLELQGLKEYFVDMHLCLTIGRDLERLMLQEFLVEVRPLVKPAWPWRDPSSSFRDLPIRLERLRTQLSRLDYLREVSAIQWKPDLVESLRLNSPLIALFLTVVGIVITAVLGYLNL